MKDSWASYPSSLLTAALNTVVGGICSLVLGFIAGTATGQLILDPDAFRPIDLWFTPIWYAIISTLRGWGLIYLPILFYLGYKTLYDDMSKTVSIYWVVLLQVLAVHVVGDPWGTGSSDYWDTGHCLRIGIFALVYCTLAWVYFRMGRGSTIQRPTMPSSVPLTRGTPPAGQEPRHGSRSAHG